MTRSLILPVALSMVALAPASAQGPGFGWRANGQVDAQNRLEWRLDRLTATLSLTDTQKQQAKTIFDGAESASVALRPSILQAQADLRAAVKTGKDIEKLSANLGALLGKERAIQVNAMWQLYSILTTAQKAEFDKLRGAGCCAGAGGGAWGGGMGRGMMGRGPRF